MAKDPTPAISNIFPLGNRKLVKQSREQYMKDSRPDNAELERVVAAALDDWRVTHVQLVQVDSSHVLLVVRCFLHLVRQPRVFHSLNSQSATETYHRQQNTTALSR